MKITLIPTGGLCNRMWSIASAYDIAKKKKAKLLILWNRYEGLNAHFYDIFQPFNYEDVELRETDKSLYHINRRIDYYKRLIPLKIQYSQILFQPSFSKGNPIEKIKGDKNASILIISGEPMTQGYNLSKFFNPTEIINQRIKEAVNKFTSNTIGVHIRRTDNTESIKQSPIEEFFKRIEEEINKDKSVSFYIASDDKKTKEDIKNRYGKRIITYMDNSERNSLQGMEFAVFDLFCLSKTKKIIGSYWSSYSAIAARLGHIELEYARKKS